MELNNTTHLVRVYDVSDTQEEGVSAFYFRPILGEAIVSDLVKTVPSATVTEIDFPRDVDHITVARGEHKMLIDRAASLLRREGRLLEHIFTTLKDSH